MAGFLFFICIIFTPSFSFAAISLNVSPSDGSSSLRLEQSQVGLDYKKDVRLRISANDGNKYQVFTRVLEPIVNEKGESLDLRAVSLATLANSNAGGTLYLQQQDALSLGEQLVYSSGQNGQSDSFVISFVLNPSFIKDSGHYVGRIIYTVRSTGGGDDQVTFPIYVETKAPWSVNIKGNRLASAVMINDVDVSEKTSDFVKLGFEGNAGQDVRVFQELVEEPTNSDGRSIDADDLIFYTAGSSGGLKSQSVTRLSRKRTLIYEGHENLDSFLVYYQINPQQMKHMLPGVFAGKLKYTVESETGSNDYFLDLKCEVNPIFTMDINVPAGGISFDKVLPNAPAKEQVVTVKVQSNLGKPYQVSQNLQALMTNEKGGQISKEYFTQKVELEQGSRGSSKFADFKPVEMGEYPVFVSDSKGSPVVFKITFKLQGYQGMNAGNFNAPIQFSLNQN